MTAQGGPADDLAGRVRALSSRGGPEALRGGTVTGTLEDENRPLEIVGVTMSNATLLNCRLDGSEFHDVTFLDCRFPGSALRETRMYNCRFFACDLSGIEISEARLDGCVFVDCKVQYSSFWSSTLIDTAFWDCGLDHAEFHNVRLEREVRMIGCSMTETSLRRLGVGRGAALDLRGSELERTKGLLDLGIGTVDRDQARLIAYALLAEANITHTDEPLPDAPARPSRPGDRRSGGDLSAAATDAPDGAAPDGAASEDAPSGFADIRRRLRESGGGDSSG